MWFQALVTEDSVGHQEPSFQLSSEDSLSLQSQRMEVMYRLPGSWLNSWYQFLFNPDRKRYPRKYLIFYSSEYRYIFSDNWKRANLNSLPKSVESKTFVNVVTMFCLVNYFYMDYLQNSALEQKAYSRRLLPTMDFYHSKDVLVSTFNRFKVFTTAP